jgi:protein-S-isoprenylcysteine O-methyltransferase Ste14
MRDRADVKVLPPILLAAALGAGSATAALFPVRLLPTGAAITIGLGAIAASLVLVGFAFREIHRAKTAFDVRKPTTAIVTTGVFRFTRNPVYLSMMLLYVGAAFLANLPWTLLLAIPTGSVLCMAAIKPEERYLDAKFGDDYRAYRARTPRWI